MDQKIYIYIGWNEIKTHVHFHFEPNVGQTSGEISLNLIFCISFYPARNWSSLSPFSFSLWGLHKLKGKQTVFHVACIWTRHSPCEDRWPWACQVISNRRGGGAEWKAVTTCVPWVGFTNGDISLESDIFLEGGGFLSK